MRIVQEEWNPVIVIEEHRQALIDACNAGTELDQLTITTTIMEVCRSNMKDREVAIFYDPVTAILGSQQ